MSGGSELSGSQQEAPAETCSAVKMKKTRRLTTLCAQSRKSKSKDRDTEKQRDALFSLHKNEGQRPREALGS